MTNWIEVLLFVIVGLTSIILIFALTYGCDIAKDKACQSIGYEKAVGGVIGGDSYCVDGERSQRVEFENCKIFASCEVYKIEE